MSEKIVTALRDLTAITLAVAQYTNIDLDTTAIDIDRGDKQEQITLRSALDNALELLGMEVRMSDMESEHAE